MIRVSFKTRLSLGVSKLTIDSNEMFENEAIHQGVDTLTTCVQNVVGLLEDCSR